MYRRARHLKCDESKPFCRRCVDLGRKCDGYLLNNHVALNLQSIQWPGDSLARRYFDFFRNRTVRDISGHFESPLWNRLVLQASHSEPAIRYAVIALGALHEITGHKRSLEHLGGNRVKISVDYPLKQYTKALSYLRQILSPASDRSLELALLCSLLLICFEILQENHALALFHLQHSLHILYQQLDMKTLASPAGRLTTQFGQAPIDEHLVQAFVRLDLQASVTVGMRKPVMASETSRTGISDLFHCVEEARCSLLIIIGSIYSFMRSTADDYRYRTPGSVPITALAESFVLERSLRQWDCSLTAFLSGPDAKMNFHDEQAISILQIQHKVAVILIATCLYAEETIFDRYNAEFERIVSLADDLIKNGGVADNKGFRFQLDLGIIQPLYFAATKCRSHYLRFHAISLLYSVPYPEGVWDGFVSAKIAERVMAIEEEKMGSSISEPEYVPEFWRIHGIGLAIDLASRRVKLTCTQRLNGMDGEWDDREELVTW